MMPVCSVLFFVFFFNDTATTEIYTTVHTLSLHDALPIGDGTLNGHRRRVNRSPRGWPADSRSHRRSEEHTSELQSRTVISYAVFCLKKKKKKEKSKKQKQKKEKKTKKK